MNVEVVRGTLSDERAAQLLAFWAAQGALDEVEAHRRLHEVVSVLLDDGDQIVGVNSVFEAAVPLIGGQRLWVYRSLVLAAAGDHAPDMLRAAFEALDAEFEPGKGQPIGLCVVLPGREHVERFPDAVWPEPRMLYAGSMGDGQQVRVGYFAGARLGGSAEPPWQHEVPTTELGQLERGYRIDLLEDGPIEPGDVIDLWTREQILSPEEAQRRVEEVLLVASDDRGELAGVSTAYLQHNPQLRMDMWYVRAFVTPAHRRSDIAFRIAVTARNLLSGRFTTGEDRRGAGVVFEVENEALKRRFDEAVWRITDFTYIGTNSRGDHVRVHYFPGAQAPIPAG